MTVSPAQPPWRVLIVEDDPTIASLHGRLVDGSPGFRTVGVASTGEEAYTLVTDIRPDLAIVDLSMPGSDGLSFLRRLRREGHETEVIVVTAVREARIVREVMHLGVVDYLVKPFAPERLQQSLAAFLARVRTLRRPRLTQDEVDRVQASGAARLPRLPKGLKRSTLVAVRRVLDASDRPLSAVEVGEAVGVARVTARRYLEYLEVIGAVDVERECSGPGRPRNRYRYPAAKRTARAAS
ncbi:MAG TPA: response regulator [Gaiellaceae bacterium]|nr:response regulator [Gaiellaceae bacterium]